MDLDGLQPHPEEGQQKESEPGVLNTWVWVHGAAVRGRIVGVTQHWNRNGKKN